MPEEINIPNTHSDEVQEIIGQAPSWILARGNVVIAIIVLLILTGAWFLRYPDVITAPVLISSYDPPVKLVAQTSGKILQIFARDGEQVETNQIIAVIDNPANTNDILILKNIIENIDTTLDMRKRISSIQLPQHLQVGEIQADYSGLYEAISNYAFFLNNTYFSKKLADIDKQEENSTKIEKTINERSKILKDQLNVEQWKDSVNKILLRDKIISLNEYNEIRKGYLSQHLNDADNLNTFIQNQQQAKELDKSILDIHQQYRTGEKDAILSIKAVAKKIKGQIGMWEKQYALKAPASGKLVFFRIRKVNQYVNSGAAVFVVVPAAQQYELRVQLPLYKAGKVKVNQPVLIKLQEYPYEEYGMLKATVASITDVSIDSAYSVELKLVNGLNTTRNRVIEFRPEISGTADIITNNKNLLQRLFERAYGKVY